MGGEKLDFLILGQGFAGTALALELLKRGKKILVIENPEFPGASHRAVGLVNPVTGRRMAKTWNYEDVIPLCHTFYKEAFSQIFGKSGSFLQERKIFKALHSVEEMNFLAAKSASDGFEDIIDIHLPEAPGLPSVFQNTVGWLEIKNGGRIDPKEYLCEAKNHLKKNHSFLEKPFLPSELTKIENGWHWNEMDFKNVVSCLGLGCPWIGSSLWAVKGQVYQFSGLPDWGNQVLKTEKFIIPLTNGSGLMGSTYEREFENELPDQTGFEEITRDLSPWAMQQFQVLDSWAGIRPTTKDRLPVIQKLDESLFALNGMGTKGVSLAPFGVKKLLRILELESGH
jgi:glycine/D-amino acid oxidase-like deaminating enzyme